MQFACYSSWEQLPDGADALLSAAAHDSLFLSRPWFDALLDGAFDAAPSLRLACVIDAERVLALLPLVESAGAGWNALSHNYTPVYSLLLAEHADDDVLRCLAQGLERYPVRALRLAPLAEDDAAIGRLQHALATRGFDCHRAFRFYNWYHRVRGQSFDDFMAARPARLRNTIARKRRRLEREHACDIRLFAGADVPPAMTDFHAVYEASWKANEQFAGLIDAVAEQLSRAGWTRLAVLYIDGQAAAAQLWFVAHAKASIFRLAYDEAWKRYSPGSILTHYLMQYVIDTDQVDEIDFLTGNEAYKRDWMSERRERWALACAWHRAAVPRRRGWITRLGARLKRDR